MNIIDILNEYKMLTQEMIEKVKNDDSIDECIKKRGNILEQIDIIGFEENEFNETYISLKICELESELEESIKQAQIQLKTKINNIKKVRAANNAYTGFGSGPYIFSTQR